jgi:DNA-binding response OmpR family regulator
VVLAAFLSGIDDYIVKPFQLSEVKNRIQRLL